MKELFKEQQEELDRMLKEGYTAKGIKAKMYKLKEIIHGPKIKPSEPMCINDPVTGELITDVEMIKKISLEHNVKILTKNPLRGEDVKERMEKQIWHDKIMNKGDIDSWNLSRELYNRVLKRIKEKGKKMFDLLNKSVESYKEEIY